LFFTFQGSFPLVSSSFAAPANFGVLFRTGLEWTLESRSCFSGSPPSSPNHVDFPPLSTLYSREIRYPVRPVPPFSPFFKIVFPRSPCSNLFRKPLGICCFGISSDQRGCSFSLKISLFFSPPPAVESNRPSPRSQTLVEGLFLIFPFFFFF